MLSRLNIAPRLALLILLGTGAILAIVTLSDSVTTRRVLVEQLRDRAMHLAVATAHRIEVITRAVTKVVGELAVVLKDQPVPPDRASRLLEDTVRAHPELFGAAIALATVPGEGASPARVAIPYVHRTGDRFSHKDLASGGYPFETADWYRLPRELGTPIWTEPYYDAGGGDSIMVTYAVPILAGPDRRFQGVVTGDLSLDWLREMLASLPLGDGGYAFLLSRKGTCVSHPEREFIMRESIFSLAETFGRDDLRAYGERMVRGDTGFVEYAGLRDREPHWLAYVPVPDTGWCLGAVFPQREIAAKLAALSRLRLLLGSLGAIAMIAVALAIARSISRPIRALDAAAQVLAGGKLDAALPAPAGSDEVARLAISFRRMRQDLTAYIEELKETTAAKARIESDLATARTIQLDLLPSRFVFNPPRPELDLHAVVDPARAVGGDFYDFSLDDSGKLFFAVGDVSGKGVPAALFMALSKAYLKAFATHVTHDLTEALSHLNDELALENDEGMFLTVFCCSLDTATGACTYANGGHPPPFILRATGRVETLPAVKGPLVGLERERTFEEGRCVLEDGDLLVAFSDGVVEAENDAQELYGDGRAAELLARLRGQRAEQVTAAIREDVRRFAGDAPQSDDITVLAVRYAAPAARARRQPSSPKPDDASP